MVLLLVILLVLSFWCWSKMKPKAIVFLSGAVVMTSSQHMTFAIIGRQSTLQGAFEWERKGELTKKMKFSNDVFMIGQRGMLLHFYSTKLLCLICNVELKCHYETKVWAADGIQCHYSHQTAV